MIFIIENNQYAMGTSVERTSNVTDLENAWRELQNAFGNRRRHEPGGRS